MLIASSAFISELIHVGQKQSALQALHDLITSKRYRSWQKPLEKIMMKYVELCVDLRKGRFAKDGLIQYRIVCQQVNVSSLEDVIKHFMQLSNEKAEQAKSQVEALEDALDVEDLEADKRPEDLMLSFVSGEKGKDRSDKEVVTPWFKFLWETYRTVLEILRNNSKLEALYAVSYSLMSILLLASVEFTLYVAHKFSMVLVQHITICIVFITENLHLFSSLFNNHYSDVCANSTIFLPEFSLFAIINGI
jgi:acetolactate synthase small subunit